LNVTRQSVELRLVTQLAAVLTSKLSEKSVWTWVRGSITCSSATWLVIIPKALETTTA